MDLYIWIIYLLILDYGGPAPQGCDSDSRACFTGVCNVPECLTCEKENTICTTSNPVEIVPRKLSRLTHSLEITYNGPPVVLDASAFSHLPSLKQLTIVGKNIMSVASKTFVSNRRLLKLNVTGSQISSLPDVLFYSKHKIKNLHLPKNRFTAFPVNVFSNVLDVVTMDFSFNPLEGCSNNKSSFNSHFEMLTKLVELRLSGYGRNSTECTNLKPGYFAPLKRISVLYLDESHFFAAGPKILLPLIRLKKLYISSLPFYRECPAAAKDIFDNLPKGLGSLTMLHWTSTAPANASCFLTNRTMFALRKLKDLDTRFSDKIFGGIISKSTFEGFTYMRELYIGWCGISFIERGAFDSLINIIHLILDGNLLGHRKLLLYSKGVNPGLRLRALNLINIGINSATPYSLSGLLDSFPNLKTLLLDSNLLRALPTFINDNGEIDHNSTSVITKLQLDKNFLDNFSSSAAKQLCRRLPGLKTLSVEDNQLTDITEMCTTIEYLRLANNRIGLNQNANFYRLAQLTMLTRLDLTNNQIDFIPSNLFLRMPRLSVLVLRQNKIQSFSAEFSFHSPRIFALDLSANLLHSVKDESLQNLTNLNFLYLDDNLLRAISPKLIQNIETNFPRLRGISIAGNPFLCTCSKVFKNWVLNSTVLLRSDSITCTPPNIDDNSVTVRVVDYNLDKFYCFSRIPLMIAGTSLAGILVSLLIALPCYKYRWYISHCCIVLRAVSEKLQEIRLEQQCEYNALVSYNSDSESDREWVEQKLIPAFEDTDRLSNSGASKKLRLFIADRDSRPGTNIHRELCDLVQKSRTVIILLTNSYLSNPSCLHQAQVLTDTSMLENSEYYHPERILVVILEELNEDIIVPPMTSLLTSNAAVINISGLLNNQTKMEKVWKKVRKFISKPKYVYRKRGNERERRQLEAEAENNQVDETTPLQA